MSALCVIPRCRARGRHLDGCDDDRCPGCMPRLAEEGFVCDWSLAGVRTQLADIIALTPAARLVAAGLVRRGTGGGGGGKPGSRSPGNDHATDVLDAVTNALTTIAREIADARGLSAPPWGAGGTDPLVRACSWLRGEMQWLRHATDEQGEPYAIAVFAEIGECLSRIRGLADGPKESKYLGPCGAEFVAIQAGPPVGDMWAHCEGDVYAYRGARTGRCRTCKTEHATDERQAWLDGEVRQHAFRAYRIAEAYGVPVNSIRTWSTRPRPDTGEPPLRSYWRTEAGIVADWPPPEDGEVHDRLHYVGDVLDLAAADAARRATQQATRARRTAAKAAEGDAA